MQHGDIVNNPVVYLKVANGVTLKVCITRKKLHLLMDVN